MDSAGGETFKESVGARHAFVARGCGNVPCDAEHIVLAEHHVEGVGCARCSTTHHERGLPHLHAVGRVALRQYVGNRAAHDGILVPGAERLAVVAYQLVAGAYARLVCHAARRNAVDARGHQYFGKARLVFQHFQQTKVAGQCKGHLFAVAQHGYAVCFADGAKHVAVHTFQLHGICAQGNVAVAETDRLCHLVVLQSVRHVAQRHVGVAPSEKYHGVNHQGRDEIHKHAANHDKQPLPRRLGAELPRFYRLLHLFRVHRLVNHARDFHIAAEGQPAEGVGRVALLGLELKEREPRVEEEAEFFYPHLENFSK